MRFGYQDARAVGITFDSAEAKRLKQVAEQRKAANARWKADLDDDLQHYLRDHPHLRARALELYRLRWTASEIRRQLLSEARDFYRYR